MIFKDVCSCFAFNVLISFSTFSIIPNPTNLSILWETINFSFQFFFQFNSVFSILKTRNSFLSSSVPFLPHYFSLSSSNTYVFDSWMLSSIAQTLSLNVNLDFVQHHRAVMCIGPFWIHSFEGFKTTCLNYDLQLAALTESLLTRC